MADSRSLSHYGITAPCLLVVEMTSESVFGEEQWTAELVSIL